MPLAIPLIALEIARRDRWEAPATDQGVSGSRGLFEAVKAALATGLASKLQL